MTASQVQVATALAPNSKNIYPWLFIDVTVCPCGISRAEETVC